MRQFLDEGALIHRLALALVICAVGQTGYAWTDGGHRLIAVLAYDRLDNATRMRINAILRNHPRFEQDFIRRIPAEVLELGKLELGKNEQPCWLVSQAAVWPDYVKLLPASERARYNHVGWHFINIPLEIGSQNRGSKSQLGPQPNRLWSPQDKEADLNAMQILDRCSRQLRDPAVSASDQAILLCWLMHVVGDIHQPLHCVTLVTDKLYPSGDRGGVDITLTNGESLHAFWDLLLGAQPPWKDIRARAARMTREPGLHQAAEEAAKTCDFNVWLDESQAVAREAVYSHEIQLSITAAEAANRPAPLRISLSRAYAENAEVLAERRGAQAGARVAALLQRFYGAAD